LKGARKGMEDMLFLLFFVTFLSKPRKIALNPIVNPTPNPNPLLFAHFICIFALAFEGKNPTPYNKYELLQID
jgi:hypothetical protein